MGVTRRLCIIILAAIYSMSAWGQSVVGDVNRDGVIDQTDVNLIAAAARTTAIGNEDPRDVNDDGRITALDVLLAALRCTQTGCAITPSVRLTPSVPTVTMVQRQAGFVTNSLHYTSPDKVERTVTISQTLTPVQGGAANGVAISPPLSTKLTLSGPATIPLGQAMTGVAPGTYRLTTTAQLGSAPAQTSTTTLTVTPAPSERALLPLSVSPGAVPIHTGADVVVSTRAVNFDPEKPPSVKLVGVDFALEVQMKDDGSSPDSAANDGVYAASVRLDAAPGTCLTVRATDGTVASAPTKLCATNLPCFPASGGSGVFTDADGASFVKDQVVISFTEGTTEEDIIALAGMMRAEIVGGLPEIHAYQFQLKTAPRSLAALRSIIAAVETFPIVASAEPSAIVKQTSAYIPTNGAYFSNQQSWASRIRLDEVWRWARGGCLNYPLDFNAMLHFNCPDVNIAVVDSGVSTSWVNLRPGYNVREGSSNTPDYPESAGRYHGTKVAGIAAAYMNTGPGITGVAPGAGVIPVKVFYSPTEIQEGPFGAAAVASAINWAAANGASVINASLTTAFSNSLCTAVANAAAAGKFVVAAAGNDIGKNAFVFTPVACAGAIGVGFTQPPFGNSPDVPHPVSNTGGAVTVLTPSGEFSTTGPSDSSDFSGTTHSSSNATPVVAGTVALMKGLTRRDGTPPYGSFTAAQLKDRLIKTSAPLATPCNNACAGGRLDVAEAVFNLSFEDSNLVPWLTTGTAGAITNVQGTCPGGPLCPQDRNQMGRLSIGAPGDGASASFSQELYPYLDNTTAPRFTVKYAFVTTRPPGARPSPVNESLSIAVTQQRPRQPVTTYALASETMNSSTLTALGGITLAGGDGTVYWTGWKTATVSAPLTPGVWSNLNFTLSASGATGGYQTIVLIDQVQLK